MKLYLNYGSTDTGTGKIKFSNVHELILIEEALQHYRESLNTKTQDKNSRIAKKIQDLDKLISQLQIENAEKLGKKYDSSIGVNLNQFLITRRHKSKILLKEIADKLKISPSLYNAVEKENQEAAPDLLVRIFDVLGVTDNINVKFHEYIPTVVFYYKDIKFHEVYFDTAAKYNDYKAVMLNIIKPDNTEIIQNKSEILE